MCVTDGSTLNTGSARESECIQIMPGCFIYFFNNLVWGLEKTLK